MTRSPQPLHDPRNDRPDVDEAADSRRIARALRRAEAAHLRAVRRGLDASRRPEGER